MGRLQKILLPALLVAGCAESPVAIDANNSLRHRRLDFAIALPLELRREGWEFRPDRDALNRDRVYDIHVRTPVGLFARTELAIEARALEVDPVLQSGETTSDWADRYPAQFHLEYDSLERLSRTAIEVAGGQGLELSFIAREAQGRDVYVYAARIIGRETSIEFAAFLPNSALADTVRDDAIRSSYDQLFLHLLPRFGSILQTVEFW